MTALPQDWLIRRAGGWTLRDVQRLPEDYRVEVLDGALIVNPSPLPVHQRIARRLAAALEGQLPAGWQLEVDIDVMLAENPLDYVAPDIVVFPAALPLTTRPVPGNAVLLVVEVVSQGSRKEDRGSKPIAYAEAGVPYYWRVEGPASGEDVVTVYVHELPPGASRYDITGVYESKLEVELERSVSIDLTALH
ncbi:Uma2 family endonuclease [Actinocrispum wychmicini]|uniref:Uma2 family endonuclease n=1 Tax=Actinocrispum wychmicini TaxID=1213861 RepID=A0A4R2K7T9_9PSEU|nr:Uma2 family endonuclease [Actinocrispum wychmicini]TCO65888.1 Uma2 family endonuclease [Actinocrispum wychmicini]